MSTTNRRIPENDFGDDLLGEEDEKINYMLVDEEQDGEDAMNEDDYDDDQHIEVSHSQPTASLNESLGDDHDDIVLDFEPDCTKANAVGFHVLCKRLERLGEIRKRKTNRLSKDEVFTVLVHASLMKHLAPISTWFPLMRLIVPEVDTSRPHTAMKERTIAMAWGEAFDLPQGSQPFQRLLNFTDPTMSVSCWDPTQCMEVHRVIIEKTTRRVSVLPSSYMADINDDNVEEIADDDTSIFPADGDVKWFLAQKGRFMKNGRTLVNDSIHCRRQRRHGLPSTTKGRKLYNGYRECSFVEKLRDRKQK